jgi:dUTPase
MHLKIKPLTDETLSFYGSHNHNYAGDCGYDLGLAEDTKVYFKATTKINLQVIITAWETISDSDFTGQMFEETWGVHYAIIPRSSIIKYPYRQANSVGLIDKNYRGSLRVAIDYLDLLTEIQPQKHVEKETGRIYSVIEKGTRLFQLVPFQFNEIRDKQIVTSQDETERQSGGFGSTGV